MHVNLTALNYKKTTLVGGCTIGFNYVIMWFHLLLQRRCLCLWFMHVLYHIRLLASQAQINYLTYTDKSLKISIKSTTTTFCGQVTVAQKVSCGVYLSYFLTSKTII